MLRGLEDGISRLREGANFLTSELRLVAASTLPCRAAGRVLRGPSPAPRRTAWAYRLDGETPSQAKLDEIAVAYTAANCGVRPIVRTICHLTIPPYSNPDEVSCEDLLGPGSLDHGRAFGIEGQQRASLGWRR